MFTKTRFDSLDLPDHLMDAISAMGWECLTEVQRDTIPLARSGRDVIGQARTGSGKTAAFGLPILESCEASGTLQSLILAPTRELAQQVAEEMTQLHGDSGLKIMTVYGGTDLEKQARGLDDGVDIIVGTPGRVMDMSQRGHLDLSMVQMFCLDEADRMLDMGFLPDIMWILERTTSRKQTLLFSATFPQEILDAANEFMNTPEFVMTNQEELDVPPIDLFNISIGRTNKLWALGRLLVRMGDEDQSIVFCNTKRMVDLAVQRLKKHRFDVASLHGDLNQNQRERIIDSFRKGEIKTVIATDVAARGIDIDGITLVVNYDVPSDSVDRDPVKKQDDYGETADVYGFVSIKIHSNREQLGSPRTIATWFEQHIRCDSLAIGDVRYDGDSTVVSIHSSKLGLAMKALNVHPMGDGIVQASVL